MATGKPYIPILWLALIAAFGSGPASAGDWQWTITPYGWLADVGLDVTVNDRDVLGGGVETQVTLSGGFVALAIRL